MLLQINKKNMSIEIISPSSKVEDAVYKAESLLPPTTVPILFHKCKIEKLQLFEFLLLFLSNFRPCISVKLQYCRKYEM